MILMKNIIKEGNEILRNTSTDVSLPLSNEDKTTIIEMLGYLFNSQHDAKAKELGLWALVWVQGFLCRFAV